MRGAIASSRKQTSRLEWLKIKTQIHFVSLTRMNSLLNNLHVEIDEVLVINKLAQSCFGKTPASPAFAEALWISSCNVYVCELISSKRRIGIPYHEIDEMGKTRCG